MPLLLFRLLEAWDAEVTVEKSPLAALDSRRCDAPAAIANVCWGFRVN